MVEVFALRLLGSHVNRRAGDDARLRDAGVVGGASQAGFRAAGGPWDGQMIQSNSTMSQQIAQAAIAFEQQRTGHTPKSVTVVISDNTLMITLHTCRR